MGLLIAGVYVPAEDAGTADPHFDKASRVHDWRNHVGERTKAAWNSFTPEQKRAIALDADDRAGAEDWE